MRGFIAVATSIIPLILDASLSVGKKIRASCVENPCSMLERSLLGGWKIRA
ncbi:hypothetical protein [Methylobacterium sp. J-076]|uniref:hypothetical protein n=1 Tax=Methylobacterium sp. J-076 TaxID=2836655 RepID=UPI001FB8E3A0|nr:hypothetical protein [Methylobacterium sp. J-076]MCJ2010961.1 hypothetical protein [Methylobacterium sp. J-076]